MTAELSANTSALASTDVTSIASVLETLVDSAANNEEVYSNNIMIFFDRAGQNCMDQILYKIDSLVVYIIMIVH